MKRTYTFVSALLLVTANLFASAPAFAHDEVVSVSPEAGSSVEAGMIDLNITFNEDVLTTDGTTGFDVVVTNAKDVTQQVGCISPMGSSLSARAAIGEPGEYTVTWHSVSNDGHPSEGTYKFTVTGTADIAADEINNCPRLLIAPMPVDDPSAIAYSTADDVNANDNTPLELGLLVLVLIVILGSAIWVTKKSKRAND
jgi:methionine-rich copper-binding protein CopC